MANNPLNIPTTPHAIEIIGCIEVAKCANPDTIVVAVKTSPVSIVGLVIIWQFNIYRFAQN
jgi:hypothetical protein